MLPFTLVEDFWSLVGLGTGDQVPCLVTRTRERSEAASHTYARTSLRLFLQI